MVPVVLFGLQAERVEAHLLLERAHRDDAQRLRLPAREQRRAVRARRDADLDRDVADLVLAAAVGALLVDGDALADDRLLELVERHLHGGAALLGVRAAAPRRRPRARRARTARGSPPRQPWSRPGARACPRPGSRVERRAVGGADLPRAAAGRPAIVSKTFFSLPTFAASSRCSAQSFLISAWAMSSASRISASGISLAPASTIRIASSVPATIRSRSEAFSASGEQVGLVRVDDEVAVDLADPHRADGRRQRDVGDHQRRRGAVHREDVVGVDVVDRERDRHQLGVIAPFLGEQRADRAVDHARGQRALLAGAALALEERAGDFPGGVHALLDVHRQREEVDVAEAARDRGAEDHRVALADDDCAGGLLGHPAGLKRDLATGDLHGDPCNGITTHIHCLPVPPVGRRSVSFFSFPNGRSLADALAGQTAEPAAARPSRSSSTPGSSPGEAAW